MLRPEWLNSDTWIIADTHFFHHRIAQYTGRPQDHNWLMLSWWNILIKPEDNVLHLGDVILASTEEMRKLAVNLPGNKYLVKGNHDSRRKLRNMMGFDTLELEERVTNSKSLYRFLRAELYGVVFSHKPLPTEWLKEWDMYNIHGHIHNLDERDYRHINMSVEVTNYKPVRFHNVLREVKKRKEKHDR
jgi:calcineurin-like phosphoesterase family protein